MQKSYLLLHAYDEEEQREKAVDDDTYQELPVPNKLKEHNQDHKHYRRVQPRQQDDKHPADWGLWHSSFHFKCRPYQSRCQRKSGTAHRLEGLQSVLGTRSKLKHQHIILYYYISRL